VTTTALDPGAVKAYIGAVDWLLSVLRRQEIEGAWDKPSVIANYTVGGVGAHAVHGVIWLEQVITDAEPVGLRAVSILEFFGANRADGGSEDRLSLSLRTAAEAFARTGPALVVAACTAARDGLTESLANANADRAIPVVRVPGGQTQLGDYLRTRVLEIVVHGDDLVCSVDGLDAPDPPATSVDVCLDVCLELARARVGDLGALRAFTRAERSIAEALRVL
jgi:hypothetical protein